jgi:hypothetical protein
MEAKLYLLNILHPNDLEMYGIYDDDDIKRMILNECCVFLPRGTRYYKPWWTLTRRLMNRTWAKMSFLSVLNPFVASLCYKRFCSRLVPGTAELGVGSFDGPCGIVFV